MAAIFVFAFVGGLVLHGLAGLSRSAFFRRVGYAFAPICFIVSGGAAMDTRMNYVSYIRGAGDAEAPFNIFEVDPDMPPDEFLKDGPAEVRFIGANQAIGSCGLRAIACYIPQQDVVVLANPCQSGFRKDAYAVLLCHELAHVQGWEHENAVSLTTFSGPDIKIIDGLRD